jgi:phage gpG-like protein
MAKFKLIGDWAKTAKIMNSMETRFRAAAQKAVLREAHYLRGQIVKNITSGGALAGKPFKALSPATLAIRRFRGFGGGKVLMHTGALRNSITVKKMAGGGAFVGVLRQSRSSAGGKSLANVAAIHEFGAGPYTMIMTERQRRFLMVALRSMGGASSPGKSSGGVLVIKIPARPFIGPVIEQFAKPDAVKRRFWADVAKSMNGDFGQP